jgi:hypothetical protein
MLTILFIGFLIIVVAAIVLACFIGFALLALDILIDMLR